MAARMVTQHLLEDVLRDRQASHGPSPDDLLGVGTKAKILQDIA
jgi:hypothetical protein